MDRHTQTIRSQINMFRSLFFNSCEFSQKIRNIHRETAVMESLFNKVALKREPNTGVFL